MIISVKHIFAWGYTTMIQILDRMFITMSFPRRLAETRKQKGLSQEALGELVGLAKLQIYRYEKGASQPTLEVLKRLAIALNTSLDALVFDEHERDPSDDLRLRFELIQQMSEQDQQAIKSVLDGMILKHQTQKTMGNLNQ
jgi:transcriptional regulator with XRE-family HTH domain